MANTFKNTRATISGAVCALTEGVRRHYRERRMISALAALSDAELKDIGLYRCGIRETARLHCASR